MFKIKIISIGKNKETWLENALAEYKKRLSQLVEFTFIWAKDNDHLLQIIEKESKQSIICLDPNGKEFDSLQFSKFIQDRLIKADSRLAFVIGGAEGLPLSLKSGYELVSLSRLTMTHQLTRLFLIEQLYRAFEIAKGSPYHK
ncbi:Ribosomal RNA large subunit methyltransferase H [Candidatus Rubidus massiliensis]|nr:Ribosomal RNA large subunit methyltransferase H [Candidatus Rubidus massiliensis]